MEMLKRWWWRTFEEVESQLCEEWEHVDEVTEKFLRLAEQHLRLSAELKLAQERVNETRDYEEISNALQHKQDALIEMQNERDQLNNQLACKSREISELNVQLERQVVDNDLLRSQISSQVDANEELKAQLTRQIQDNHELNSQLNRQVAEYEELKAQLAEQVEESKTRVGCAVNLRDSEFEAADFARSVDKSLLAADRTDIGDDEMDLAREGRHWKLSTFSDQARAEDMDVPLEHNLEIAASTKLDRDNTDWEFEIFSDQARAEEIVNSSDKDYRCEVQNLQTRKIDLSGESKEWEFDLFSDQARCEESVNSLGLDQQRLQTRNIELRREIKDWDFTIFSDEGRGEESDDELSGAHDEAFVEELLEDVNRLNAAYDEKCAELAQLQQAYVELLSDSKEEAMVYHSLPSSFQVVGLHETTIIPSVHEMEFAQEADMLEEDIFEAVQLQSLGSL